jgi:hypothetical protein
MGIGDWGLGDWGLGPIPNPQSPIPNPQSPIINCIIINNKFNCLIFLINKLMNSSDISKKTNDNSNIKVMSDS